MTNLQRIQKAKSANAVALIILGPYFMNKKVSPIKKRLLVNSFAAWLESEVQENDTSGAC